MIKELIRIENNMINILILERQLQNKTQSELAFASNLYPEDIKAIEDKQKSPSLSSLLAISKALNLTIDIKYKNQYEERKAKGW